MKNITMWVNRIALIPLLMAGTILTGCDSDGSDGDGLGETVEFQGRVTDDAGYGKQAGPVEGAVVTAAALDARGNLTTLEGQATTDADGAFSLEVDGASEVVVLSAAQDSFSFRSDVLGYRADDDDVRVMPMTTESKAEAAVYVESVAQDTAVADVSVADVAVLVNARLAAAQDAGDVPESDIAAAILASAQAEAGYLETDTTDIDRTVIRNSEERAFAMLQADLYEADDAAAQDAAIDAFEQAFVEAYTEAGASLEIQAEARQASLAALLKFYSPSNTEARFALRQQAEILAARVTAQTIEAAFEADGASQDRLDALAQAHTTLLTALRTASSEAEIDAAQDAYAASVEDEVMAELNIDAALLATVEAVLTTAKATLDSSVAAAGSADAVASAYATFHTTAQAEAETTLAASSNADLGAHVLTLLTTQ